jgi:hypothetical protein
MECHLTFYKGDAKPTKCVRKGKLGCGNAVLDNKSEFERPNQPVNITYLHTNTAWPDLNDGSR